MTANRSRSSRWQRFKEAVIPSLVRLVPSVGRFKSLRAAMYRRILAEVGHSGSIHPSVDFSPASAVEVGNGVTIWPQVHFHCHGPNNSIRLSDGVILDRGVVIKALNQDTGRPDSNRGWRANAHRSVHLYFRAGRHHNWKQLPHFLPHGHLREQSQLQRS